MITVLTTTYNRRHTLGRLYRSLLEQNNNNFEWVVVDDGSVDDTAVLIKSCANTAPFKVNYVFQNNSGKHVAVNNGVVHSSGEYILIVDSDDALTENAVDLVYKAINTAAEDIVGICFRKSYFDGHLIGNDTVSTEAICMHPSVAGYFFGGDLAYIFTKRILVENPFPVFTGEKFVPELYIWNRIGDKGEIAYYPSNSIYLCEYLPDGYSANFRSNLRKNPKGFRIFYADQFYREKTLTDRVKCAIRVVQCLYYQAVRGFRQ